MNEKTAAEILRAISLTGAADEAVGEISVDIGNREQALELFVSRAGGLPQFKPYQAKKFELIIAQPELLSILNPFTIRCCLCGKVIAYPAWHRIVRYVRNQFHFFVCFDSRYPFKPNVNCYRS